MTDFSPRHPPHVSRRDFLGASAAAAAGLALGAPFPGRALAGTPADESRLLARPRHPDLAPPPKGESSLGLDSSRDARLYVPPSYDPAKPAPFALALHGATGYGAQTMIGLRELADEHGLIVLTPLSREGTWDAIGGSFGPDVAFINRALTETFRRCAVNPAQLAIAGFSDGASYALSLGLANGDLFPRVIAFSPGFVIPAPHHGKPRIFISHGTRDQILPIDQCSRRIVPELKRQGYAVDYREFDGPHAAPLEMRRAAMEWLFSKGQESG